NCICTKLFNNITWFVGVHFRFEHTLKLKIIQMEIKMILHKIFPKITIYHFLASNHFLHCTVSYCKFCSDFIHCDTLVSNERINSFLVVIRGGERGRPLRGSSLILVFPSLKCFTHLLSLLAPMQASPALTKRNIDVCHFGNTACGHMIEAMTPQNVNGVYISQNFIILIIQCDKYSRYKVETVCALRIMCSNFIKKEEHIVANTSFMSYAQMKTFI
ncbi:hypothetical protein L9F63_006882, partial [Diploptera punctata]